MKVQVFIVLVKIIGVLKDFYVKKYNMKKFLGLLIFMFLITENAFAKCKKEDYENFFSTKYELDSDLENLDFEQTCIY